MNDVINNHVSTESVIEHPHTEQHEQLDPFDEDIEEEQDDEADVDSGLRRSIQDVIWANPHVFSADSDYEETREGDSLAVAGDTDFSSYFDIPWKDL